MRPPSMPRTARRALLASALTLAAGFVAGSTNAPASLQTASHHGETLGMTAILFRLGNHSGADDCPQIAASSSQIWLEHYATPEQRARLSRPENDDELQTIVANAPGYTDMCSGVAAKLASTPNWPAIQQVRGHQSYGLNLDGTTDGHATANTCAHPKFEGLNGEVEVDNQLYRVMGCQRLHRWETRTGEGKVRDVYDYDASSSGNKELAIGEETTLLELAGVDDRRNDPDVDVYLSSGNSTPLVGQDGRPLPWTTQTVSRDPQWTAHVKGRIVDGVLTTDRFDFKLMRHTLAPRGTWEMRGARIRLELTADGGAKGVIGGYMPIEAYYYFEPVTFLRGWTQGGKFDCPGQFRGLYDAADGYPDPVTGQCTAISAAIAVQFIPAYIRHADTVQANAGQTAPSPAPAQR